MKKNDNFKGLVCMPFICLLVFVFGFCFSKSFNKPQLAEQFSTPTTEVVKETTEPSVEEEFPEEEVPVFRTVKPKEGLYYRVKDGKTVEKISFQVGTTAVTVDKGTDVEILEQVYIDLLNLPKTFRKAIKEVVLVPWDIATGFKFDANLKNRIAGICNGTSIYLNDSKYASYVLIHEGFHAQDFNLAEREDGWFADESPEWSKLWTKYTKAEKYPMSDNWYICIDDRYEYFASCGQLWFQNPKLVKKEAREVYDFFETLYKDKDDMKERSTYELPYLD